MNTYCMIPFIESSKVGKIESMVLEVKTVVILGEEGECGS